MPSDDRNDTPTSSSSSREPEKNPFVAFRHHVDHQINSLFGSVVNLPSTIYNRGAEHGRQWSERRQQRSQEGSADDKSSRPPDIGKEWEQAMKDFENSEREAKEWYDTVLKQITSRRDTHLESGLGFGEKETKAEGKDTEASTEESCPYLPPKEQRLSPASEAPRTEGRSGRGREHPHSRFFDWVWSGWGGPSTTPNMLWHQERQPQNSRPAKDLSKASAMDGTSERLPHDAQDGDSHALQDFQMQLMLLDQQNKERLLMAEQEQDSMTNPPPPPGAHPMSTNYCAGDMDEEDPLAQHLAEPFSYMRWLLSNCYSPLLIEKHPELGYDCRAWRSAYEDLLRAQLDEPLMTMEEMEGAECEDEDFWTARVAFLHSMTSLTREERKKLSSLKEQFPMMPEAFREHAESSNSRSKKDVIAEDFDQIQKELKGTLNSPESGPWDELIQVLARGLALEMEERDPNSELDAYIEQWKDKSTSWKQHFSQMMAPQRAPEDQKPSALGMLTKTERVYNSDGTVTEKTVLKESFANNRTKTTETTKTTDENGAIKAETSSTVESSGSAHHWPQVEWNAPEDVTAPERHEPGAVLNALQSAQRRDRGHGRERKGEKKSSGWFWKN